LPITPLPSRPRPAAPLPRPLFERRRLRLGDEAETTELAEAMIGLGATEAINLDGGGSASLVVGGSLVNTPREEHGIELGGGRAVATALHFAPRLTF
jgi:exopolysaccharide biosynthesis protein